MISNLGQLFCELEKIAMRNLLEAFGYATYRAESELFDGDNPVGVSIGSINIVY